MSLIYFPVYWDTIYGDYSGGVHLFPFRTEKLSPLAQMVLPERVGEYVVAGFSPGSKESGLFCGIIVLSLERYFV